MSAQATANDENSATAPDAGAPDAAKAGPPSRPLEHKHMSVRRHLVLDSSIIIGVAVAWLVVIFGYQWLTEPPLPKVDMGSTDQPLVVLHVEKLDTKDQRLVVKVVFRPSDAIFDKRLHRLTADTAVRFPSQDDLGELQYSSGMAPQPFEANIDARGDALHWPFDTYVTDAIQAEWLVGAGDSAHYETARLEVDGMVDGFDISLERVRDNDPNPDAVIIKLKRASGPRLFDLGICLVLITLPALALFVAIQMVTRRRPFLPPFGTWYAAMLFAVVPLRNFLPGNPPMGAWVDQGLVIWVLLGLAAAMVIYIVAWYRDRAA